MVFKKKAEKKILQEIYDCNFKQLELSIREMGYGDVAINKKMKTYLNIFHAILERLITGKIYLILKKVKFYLIFLI